jgi:hypothetical protein
VAIDLRFLVCNNLEKRSVKMCGTLEDWISNRSQLLDVGEMRTIYIPR